VGAVHWSELGEYSTKNSYIWYTVKRYHTNDYTQMAAWEFQTLQNIADKNRWHKFISMQNYYNLLYREEEREMVRLSSVL
jgi:hypothetical protein